ncbi:Sir2 family NAD-dependent protein deacetylase [Acanthopleuribacter pedis]|uniref:protein acetyllysine N-acetyltransferase n=1 Tax=Acanthopleuribacter pedis TaxID=442870 RepID=A0A8J7U4Z8_9BACT|nr:hypothetical protein [Acanthopleuribacter pedis]
MSERKKLVAFTGAGVSAGSGLKTYRDLDGLWTQENHEAVASVTAWHRNREPVLAFWNKVLTNVREAQPNDAHRALADLQDHLDVTVVTQNIDDLHERAGSKRVLHLHGEITKVQGALDPKVVTSTPAHGFRLGDKCARGSQLRPHIVWFGEPVLHLAAAAEAIDAADLFWVIGTSLTVYPAAGLVDLARCAVDKVLINPGFVACERTDFRLVAECATIALPRMAAALTG